MQEDLLRKQIFDCHNEDSDGGQLVLAREKAWEEHSKAKIGTSWFLP